MYKCEIPQKGEGYLFSQVNGDKENININKRHTNINITYKEYQTQMTLIKKVEVK